MRRFGRILGGIVLVLVAFVGALHVALPARVAPGDGAADPILFVRRPVVRLLGAIGVLRDDPRFADPYVPTRFGTKSYGPDDGRPFFGVEWTYEPVYRGLFWPVGSRVTCRVDDRTSDREAWQGLRLRYVRNGRKSVVAEASWRAPSSEVSGFVPCGVTGFWVERIDRDGEADHVGGWDETE